MALKFDQYYSLFPRQPSRVKSKSSPCSKFEIVRPGRGQPSGSEKAKLEAVSLNSRWTLWTLRDPVLITDMFSAYVRYMDGLEKIWIWETRTNFLHWVATSCRKVCSEFPEIPTDAIVVKSRSGKAYRSDNILIYGEAFCYSRITDTISVDALEVGFEENGNFVDNITPGIITLKACGGLAEMLTSCVKKDDIFVIVGRELEGKTGVPEVILNSTRAEDLQQQMEPLTIVRLSMDPFNWNASFVEKIYHHKGQSFAFKYAAYEIDSGYCVDFLTFRTFSLESGRELPLKRPVPCISRQGDFQMPLSSSDEVEDAYEHLLSFKGKKRFFEFDNQGGRLAGRKESSPLVSGSHFSQDYNYGRVAREESFGVKILKMLFGVIIPLIVLCISVLLFTGRTLTMPNQVAVEDTCVQGSTPTTDSAQDQWSGYNNYNYENGYF